VKPMLLPRRQRHAKKTKKKKTPPKINKEFSVYDNRCKDEEMHRFKLTLSSR
jgi:hypothetical protein